MTVPSRKCTNKIYMDSYRKMPFIILAVKNLYEKYFRDPK